MVVQSYTYTQWYVTHLVTQCLLPIAPISHGLAIPYYMWNCKAYPVSRQLMVFSLTIYADPLVNPGNGCQQLDGKLMQLMPVLKPFLGYVRAPVR